MKNILIIFFINFCIATSIQAQISHEKRIEIKLPSYNLDEKIHTFGKIYTFEKNGFIMYSKLSKYETKVKGKREWKYEKYDTELNKVETKSILLGDNLVDDIIIKKKENLYSLFSNKKGNFSLFIMNSTDLKTTKIDGILPKKAFTVYMDIIGDYAFISLWMKKAPFLFSVNLKNGKTNLISVKIKNIDPKETYISGIKTLENANKVIAYVTYPTSNKKSYIYVYSLSLKDNSIEIFDLTKNIEEKIMDLSVTELNEEKYILTGTYSNKSRAYSNGLFFSQISNNKLDDIKFYNYLDLDNFLTHMLKKKKKKAERKKEKREEKGKEDKKINYRVIPHEIIPLYDGCLFLGEAYYDTYATGYDGSQRTLFFDGFQYTHAIICKFDNDGNLLWDKTFKMQPKHKPFIPKHFIAITEKSENSIKLVYSSENKINSKSIDFNGSVLQEVQLKEMETQFETDKVKFSRTNSSYWYDNYFISYGHQKIKNKDDDKKTKKKRWIYFVNKIKFDN